MPTEYTIDFSTILSEMDDMIYTSTTIESPEISEGITLTYMGYDEERGFFTILTTGDTKVKKEYKSGEQLEFDF